MLLQSPKDEDVPPSIKKGLKILLATQCMYLNKRRPLPLLLDVLDTIGSYSFCHKFYRPPQRWGLIVEEGVL